MLFVYFVCRSRRFTGPRPCGEPLARDHYRSPTYLCHHRPHSSPAATFSTLRAKLGRLVCSGPEFGNANPMESNPVKISLQGPVEMISTAFSCFLQASLPDPTFARRTDCLYHVHNKTGAASPIGAAAEARAAQHTGLIWLPVKSAGTEGALDIGGDLERRGGIAAAFNSHGFGGNTTGRKTPGWAIISRTKAPSNPLAPSRQSARRAGKATNHVESALR